MKTEAHKNKNSPNQKTCLRNHFRPNTFVGLERNNTANETGVCLHIAPVIKSVNEHGALVKIINV